MDQSRRSCLLSVATLGIALCLGLVCVAGAALGYFMLDPELPFPLAGDEPTSTPGPDIVVGATSTPLPPTPTNTPPPGPVTESAVVGTPVPSPTVGLVDSPYPVPEQIERRAVPPAAYADLDALFLMDFPIHDYYESAQRLTNADLGPRTKLVPPYQVGDERRFITDRGTANAILVAVTDNVYYWVEEGAGLAPGDVRAVAEIFERDYYPRLSQLFGQAWQPGMDGDPRFSVLHLERFAGTELGFFDSNDEYPQSVATASNEQEIIYLNMSRLDLGSPLYFATLIHEYQHLVQWYADANETVWLDEGLSQLAELYLGLDTIETADYLDRPDLQLNTWSYENRDVFGHYAASYLFLVYLWEQLGDDAMAELARHPANGLQAVRAVLAGYRPDLTLEDLVAEWAVANWLDEQSSDPRHSYRALALPPAETEAAYAAPADGVHEIEQFGVHYLDLDRGGATTLTFAGQTRTRLLPTAPYSGSRMWAVPGVDNVSAQLTRAFDLSGVNEATLTFWTWYALEEDYDYAYVTISIDGGQTWRVLLPENGTAGGYGPGFNGRSDEIAGHVNGWVREEISLNAYVGREVLIRFEVLTDGGYVEDGFALDNIAIPEIGYATDVEGDRDGWEPAGFIQTGNILPQLWELRLIDNATGQVTDLPLDGANQNRWPLTLGPRGATLVVVPVTPFVYEPVQYWINVE